MMRRITRYAPVHQEVESCIIIGSHIQPSAHATTNNIVSLACCSDPHSDVLCYYYLSTYYHLHLPTTWRLINIRRYIYIDILPSCLLAVGESWCLSFCFDTVSIYRSCLWQVISSHSIHGALQKVPMNGWPACWLPQAPCRAVLK